MAATQIDVKDLHAQFAEVVARANAGDEVILTHDGAQCVKLIPLPAQPVRQLGLHAGAFQVADDFDAPLPEGFWLSES